MQFQERMRGHDRPAARPSAGSDQRARTCTRSAGGCAAPMHAAALEAASPGRGALLVFPAGVCTVP